MIGDRGISPWAQRFKDEREVNNALRVKISNMEKENIQLELMNKLLVERVSHLELSLLRIENIADFVVHRGTGE